MSAASTPVPVILKKSLGWSIGLSILMIAAGLLAIVIPPVAGIAVTIFVAWLLLFSGVAHLVYGWHTRHNGGMVLEWLVGILYAGIGLYMLVNPVLGLASLTLALAAYLLLEGILELILSYRLRPASGWGWLLFDGIFTLILAVLIWKQWPSSGLWAVGWLVGFSMIFSGSSRLMLSLAARKLVASPA
jgi:uncharacterized membrane protein HdeD (DUF308 family)